MFASENSMAGLGMLPAGYVSTRMAVSVVAQLGSLTAGSLLTKNFVCALFVIGHARPVKALGDKTGAGSGRWRIAKHRSTAGASWTEAREGWGLTMGEELGNCENCSVPALALARPHAAQADRQRSRFVRLPRNSSSAGRSSTLAVRLPGTLQAAQADQRSWGCQDIFKLCFQLRRGQDRLNKWASS
jgi:hypothetical protein